jgi:hypothetical protein
MARTHCFRFAAHVDTKTRSGILAELAENVSAFCAAVDTETIAMGGFRSEESAGQIRILAEKSDSLSFLPRLRLVRPRSSGVLHSVTR